ncbi:Tn3 family transposase [Spirillospora sp. CA-253888]
MDDHAPPPHPREHLYLARRRHEGRGQLRRLPRPDRDRLRRDPAAGFDLLPRIKQINKVKLYRVEAGESDRYPQLTPAMTRPIRSTESASHPVYQAMLEVGRAQKTIFVARYLRLRELQCEIQEGLNVVEASNGTNSVILYGKGGDIATSRREELELTVCACAYCRPHSSTSTP